MALRVDYNDHESLGRLRDAIEFSRRRLQPFREHRYSFIQQYVGYHYSEDGSRTPVPVNLIEMAVNIFIRHLAPQNPRALVVTEYEALKAHASDFEVGINHLLNEISFAETLRRLVSDALFAVGICKTGLVKAEPVEVEGFQHDVTQPFADVVDLDDWVHDMSAKRWDQISFAGHRYRLPLEIVKQSKNYDSDITKNLVPSERASYNEEGDIKVETLSRGIYHHQDDEFMPYVELWDLWLPYHNQVVTLPADSDGGLTGPPMRVVDWDGPESGPFRMLSFSDVPGQIMPLAPAALWMDLHILTNTMFRKLGRQAERQKSILAVPPNAIEDGERVVQSSDGEAIRIDSPNQIHELKYGGIDNVSLAFSIQVKELFSYLSGNLDVLGGLGPQAPTFSQDALLQNSASKRVADMQDRVVDFTKQVISDMAFYLWHDPLIDLEMTKRIPGFPDDIPVRFSADTREGDYLDYNISIEPYSLQHQTPASRLRTIENLFQRFIIPAAPLLQQQNIAINWENFLKTIARYTNMVELEDLLMFFESQEAPDQPVQPRGAGMTTRVEERRSIPGASFAGKDSAMIQALLGSGQPQSAAGIMRPTG